MSDFVAITLDRVGDFNSDDDSFASIVFPTITFLESGTSTFSAVVTTAFVIDKESGTNCVSCVGPMPDFVAISNNGVGDYSGDNLFASIVSPSTTFLESRSSSTFSAFVFTAFVKDKEPGTSVLSWVGPMSEFVAISVDKAGDFKSGDDSFASIVSPTITFPESGSASTFSTVVFTASFRDIEPDTSVVPSCIGTTSDFLAFSVCNVDGVGDFNSGDNLFVSIVSPTITFPKSGTCSVISVVVITAFVRDKEPGISVMSSCVHPMLDFETTPVDGV
eukprot:CAMPEP_0168249104 /NCGR_PEP_ID=MMETSP0141_2-20121125/1823_1 /TAXON_ID=44445 /ORGANISM="Pseudo-nitzschia australis, Strain 10249 10 AB" /LENGTH=275 /DNA_ID=CAMNT_0008185075 /DNA_START=711 /DNA_END=1535 /DNA_ORIENTATION=+